VSGRNEPEQGRLLRAALAALENPTLAERLPRDGDADLGPFIEVARHHRLTPLLSVVAGEGLAGELAAACRKDRLLTVARNLALTAAAQECVRALAEKGVAVIVLKGIAYDCAFYSGAGTRPTADVDLLVPADRRRAAFAVLDRLGFEPRAAAAGFDEADYHEVAWRRGDIEVDLHMALAPLVRCQIDYDEVWRCASPITIGDTVSRMLDGKQAAVFHALHMAIDHFEVPALYLLDLARQLPSQSDLDAAQVIARAWGCRRPFETAVALAGEFLPLWRGRHGRRSVPWFARRVTSRYGSLDPLPRSEQLVRKLSHIDDPVTALRYTVVQGRRKAREVLLRRFYNRSARERLALGPK
jgi:hypothetical protein